VLRRIAVFCGVGVPIRRPRLRRVRRRFASPRCRHGASVLFADERIIFISVSVIATEAVSALTFLNGFSDRCRQRRYSLFPDHDAEKLWSMAIVRAVMEVYPLCVGVFSLPFISGHDLAW